MSIKGNVVGNLAPRSDYDQTDPEKSNFIKNKPIKAIEKAQKTADEALPKVGGTMTGGIDMGGNKITNLPAPEQSGDAVNREYVDSKHFLKTVTLLASGWSASAPYTQTVTVAGILSTDVPHWGVVYSNDIATALAQKEAFAVIDDLDTADGSVTFTCFEDKPEVDLTIQMEVNR